MESIDRILAERGDRYGDFETHAAVTQHFKRTMRVYAAGWNDLDYYHREALEMISHKIGRILNGDPNYVDSWRDIEGYAKLVADILERQQTDPN